MAYISKVKSPDNTTYDIKSYKTQAIPSGAVADTSTATAFTATVDGIASLYNGVCCYLTNGEVTSASGATLNINSLGAKPIYLSNKASTGITTEFGENVTGLFIYNEDRVSGGCWDFIASGSEIPELIVTYDDETVTELSYTGTAHTAEPTYTPSGSVIHTTEYVSVTGELDYSFSNYVLSIKGIKNEMSTPVVTSISGFEGNGVRLIAKEEEIL